MTQEAEVPLRDDYKPRRAIKRRRSSLPLYIALIVVAVLIVTGLFFLGLALPGMFTRTTAVPTPTPTSTPTPTPTPTAPPVGPVPAGTYAWDELGGGECLTGYTSPWAEEFTVVGCTEPHTAQLVRRGLLEGIVGTPYPGESAITEQMGLLCTDPGVLDADAAAAYSWMQWQAAYPPNTDDWNKGDRSYYCFFSRASGETMTTSLVVTP